MKLTKKQVIVGGVVALLIAGAGAGVVHNHNVQAEKAKQVQKEKVKKQAIENAKQTDKELVIQAKAALAEAQKSPSSNNLELAKKAISHVKDDKTSKQLTKELDGIKTRVKLETEAKKAVADKAKKAEEAKKSAQTAKALDNSNQTAKSNASEVNQPQAENSVVTDPAPTDNGGVSNNNAYQPAPQTPQAPVGGGSGNNSAPNPPSTGGGNTVTPSTGEGNSGGNSNTGGNNGTVTPPPAETFTGWVRNKEGQIVWSQGGFSSLAEAGSAATAWCNANATSGGWSSGAY